MDDASKLSIMSDCYIIKYAYFMVWRRCQRLVGFLGLIYMYFNDHNPPHFYVKYNEHRAIMNIENLALDEGYLPPRVLGLVVEWAELHQKELMDNWKTIMATGQYAAIPPLV
jgi:hypothetical protein